MPKFTAILLGNTVEVYDVLLYKSFSTLGRNGKSRTELAIIFLYLLKHNSKITKWNYLILQNMIRIWRDARFYFIIFLKEPFGQSQFSPIWGNQLFIPCRMDGMFKVKKVKDFKLFKTFICLKLIHLWVFRKCKIDLT